MDGFVTVVEGQVDRGLVAHEVCVSLIRYSQPYATGAAKITASTTSSTPPKPGTAADASFFWQSRLTSDSARSPRMPATPTVTPKPTSSGQLSCNTGAGPSRSIATAVRAATVNPPTAPSQVFLGLSTGVIRCRPNSRPAAYAPMSQHFGTKIASARATLPA